MKPTAVICDIDGTLAHMNDRSPYDTTKYSEDSKDTTVAFIFERVSKNATKIICSGRSEEHRAVTEQWLKDNHINFDHFYMRATGDKRNDAVVKQEIYDTHIKSNYEVMCVLDDRDRVVKMWRDNGLKCLQVAYGDF